LFNANSAIFQLYHDENKLIFNEMMMSSALKIAELALNKYHSLTHLETINLNEPNLHYKWLNLAKIIHYQVSDT
jgi:hypothetical protein